MVEEKLIKEYGSPVYVYEEKKLINRVNKLLNFSKQLQDEIGIKVKMHYSTKANANLRLLRIIKDLGMSVDSMSPVELAFIENAGFDKQEILYVCNNVSQNEMKKVVEKGILICLDSVVQVEVLGKACPNTNIMIRINPEEEGVGHCKKVVTSGKEARFGILEKDFEKLFEITKKYNLNIIGIHQHLGSSFFNNDIEQYLLGIEKGLEIIKRNFSNIKIIDLGGGFGVPYKENEEELDLNLLAQKLVPILKDFKTTSSIFEVKFEPGRYVVCDSSYILGTVNSIKETYNTTWIGTDVGMNVLARPSMYDAYHKIEIINNKEGNKEYIIANIAGNVCESGDVLGKERKVLNPKIGDLVKIYNTGAYGYSMSSTYTGRLRTAEVLINKKGKIELIKKRENIEDMMSLYV